jgi:hypothetical protein
LSSHQEEPPSATDSKNHTEQDEPYTSDGSLPDFITYAELSRHYTYLPETYAFVIQLNDATASELLGHNVFMLEKRVGICITPTWLNTS